MKTICPHCYQKYNVEDNFLQQKVICSICKQNFTVEKAKFCADCGTINPMQYIKCRQCGKEFPPQRTAPPPQRTFSTCQTTYQTRVSSAETVSRITKYGFNMLASVLAVPVFTFIWSLDESYKSFPPAFWLIIAAAVIFYIAATWPAFSLVVQLANPNAKIVWSLYKKISMGIATMTWIVVLIFWIIDTIKSPSGLYIGPLITYLLTLTTIPTAWKLAIKRAQEDMGWEPDQETDDD